MAVALAVLWALGLGATPAASAGSIAGRVTTTDGSAITGIVVDALDGDDALLATATTNATGNYLLGGLPAATLTLAFSDATAQYVSQRYGQTAGRGPPTAIALGAGQARTGTDQALTAAARIAGVVRATGGALLTRVADPAAEYVVTLWDTDEQYVDGAYIDESTGTYALAGLAPGTYRVRFEAGGYVGETYDDAPLGATGAAITLGADEQRGAIDAQLSVGGQISGSVAVAGESGPVGGGVLVRAFNAAEAVVATTSVEEDGSYRLTGVPAGLVRVQFDGREIADGGAPLVLAYYDAQGTLAAATPVTVEAGQTTAPVNATLARESAEVPGGLIGTVSGTTGRPGGSTGPLKGTTVRLYDAARQPYGVPKTTGADGTYEFGIVSPGTYYVGFAAAGHVSAFHAGHTTLAAATPVTVAGGAATTVDASLTQTPGALSGVVNGSAVTGGHLSGATVSVFDASATSTAAPLATAQTGADGRWTVAGLAPGSYTLLVEHPDYLSAFYDSQPTLAAATPVAVGSGATTNTATQLLIARRASLQGTITAADGGALSGATVTLISGGAEQSVTTGAGGSYAFSELYAATEYHLKVARTEYATAFFDGAATLAGATAITLVPREARTADMTLAPLPATLTGRVTDADGNLAGATVTAYGATGTATVGPPSTTAADGTYALALPAGSYRLGFTKAGWLPRFWDAQGTLATATLIPAARGATVSGLSVRMTSETESGSLAGTITDGAAPLSGATVTVSNAATGAVAGTTTAGTDGRWQLSGLAPAAGYHAQAVLAGYAAATTNSAVGLAPGQARTGVDLVLTAQPGVLRGTVRWGQATLAGVTVTTYEPAGPAPAPGVAAVTTAADGTFAITVPAGDYRLGFTKPAFMAGYLGDSAAPVPALAGARVLTVARDETKLALEVSLVGLPGSLAGTITDGSGPLAGATVTVREAVGNAVAATVLTDPQGRWKAPELTAGEYRVAAALTGYADAAPADVMSIGPGEDITGIELVLAANPVEPGDPIDPVDPGTGSDPVRPPGPVDPPAADPVPVPERPQTTVTAAVAVAPRLAPVTGPRRHTISQRGRFVLKLRCPATGVCAGRIVLTTRLVRKPGQPPPAQVVIGTATVRGTAVTQIVIVLTARGRKLVMARRGGRRVTLKITAPGARKAGTVAPLTLRRR